jgi:uncharacterized membrane protein YphA (DoxX/SURF4 family)
MKGIAQKAAVFYARILLGSVFLLSGMEKVADVKGFAIAVGDYQILPAALTLPFAYCLSWTEVLLGLAMVFEVRLREAGALASLLMAVFMTAGGIAKFRGLDIDCGCFNLPLFGSPKIGWHTFARDMLFLALALVLIFIPLPKNENSQEPCK